MPDQLVRERGVHLLTSFEPQNNAENKAKDWLLKYEFDANSIDDDYAWMTCILALTAIGKGNFGIGCILVDAAGNIEVEGYNEVFTPYFRSDRHGEMVVINSFEDNHKGRASLKDYSLYSSLESCPMCLTRLITSGIGKVSYVAPDLTGGMVHKIKDLPEVWRQLSENQIFNQAKCSETLINMSFEIFLINAEKLNDLLKCEETK